jgi:hypothetical protein
MNLFRLEEPELCGDAQRFDIPIERFDEARAVVKTEPYPYDCVPLHITTEGVPKDYFCGPLQFPVVSARALRAFQDAAISGEIDVIRARIESDPKQELYMVRFLRTEDILDDENSVWLKSLNPYDRPLPLKPRFKVQQNLKSRMFQVSRFEVILVVNQDAADILGSANLSGLVLRPLQLGG